MTPRVFLLPALAVCLCFASATFGRPVRSYTGDEIIDKSQVIVAVQSSGFEVVRKGDADWLVLRPDAVKAFKGTVPSSEIRIKSMDPGQRSPGKFAFPSGKLWLLLFLREWGGGNYEFAVDSLGQGQFGVPSDVDPRESAKFDDFLVALANSSSRTSEARLDDVFLLLAGLPSEKARLALSDLSLSENLHVAATAILARIQGGDETAFQAAAALMKRDGLRPDDKVRLESAMQNHKEPEKDSDL